MAGTPSYTLHAGTAVHGYFVLVFMESVHCSEIGTVGASMLFERNLPFSRISAITGMVITQTSHFMATYNSNVALHGNL